MEKPINPRIQVGKLRLLGNYWFQLVPGQDATVVLEPSTLKLILKVEEFDLPGELETKQESPEDKQTLTLSFLHMKKMGIGGYGTKQPLNIGHLGNLELWASYILKPFVDSVHISLALYIKDLEEANGAKAG